MIFHLQVPDIVNKPFRDRLCHLYKEWLLPGNYPLTPAGNIRRASEVLLGMTFYKNLLSEGLKMLYVK
jgi:hypothetical protein